MTDEEKKEFYEHHKKVIEMTGTEKTIQLKCIKNEENIAKFELFKNSFNFEFDALYSALRHNIYGYITSVNNMIGEAYLTSNQEEIDKAFTDGANSVAKNSTLFYEPIYHVVSNFNYIVGGGANNPFFKIDDVETVGDVTPTDTVISICINGESYELVRFTFVKEINPAIIGSITTSDPVANKFNYINDEAIEYLRVLSSLKKHEVDMIQYANADIENIAYNVKDVYYTLGMFMYPILKYVDYNYGDVFAFYVGKHPADNLTKLADAIVKYLMTNDSVELNAIIEDLKYSYNR